MSRFHKKRKQKTKNRGQALTDYRKPKHWGCKVCVGQMKLTEAREATQPCHFQLRFQNPAMRKDFFFLILQGSYMSIWVC